jgi:signal transduction histidine kinase
MLDLKTALLLVVALSIVVIGLTIYLKQRRNPAALAFVVFTLGVSFWALTNALFQLTDNHSLGIIAALASYYAGVCIALPFYSFSANFPIPLSIAKQKKLVGVLWAYGVVWGALIGIPGITLVDVIYDPTGRIVTGPGIYFYAFSLAMFLIGGMIRLWRKRRQAVAIERRQINVILIGMAVSATFGMFFNLLLPILNNYSLVWLGPDFALILVALMAYAMVRHRLFDLRILTTEIFTALLGLVMVVELLRSQTTLEISVRAAIIVIYIYLARQMLNSVYEEIRAKEALRAVNDQLQTVNEELQELINIKTDFIHAASHQLRTPLTAIRGLLTMEYEGDYDDAPLEERRRLQRNVLTSVERLTNIVNDLLRAAELEHGMTGEAARGDIAPLVERAIETLRPNYTKKSIHLDYQPPAQPLPRMMIRENYLEQVFMNLLDNAERYSPSGSSVTVRLVQENNAVIFSVTDRGLGFTEADKIKLFTKFGRADKAKAMQPNGSGLGLYIVKRIIEEHCGTVTAHSAGLNQGATFMVTLPITDRSKQDN